MRQKAVTLVNRGMNRDMSVSKIYGSSAYENRNIRITVMDNDTMLSVTNERGNKEYSLNESIQGELLGWNVLNNHIVLFTHEGESTDRIYRIDYEDGGFTNHLLYPTRQSQGSLGFDMAHPIESIVYHETEAIQKIYWVDGIHVLRFMNFMAGQDEIDNWDSNSFDSNIFSDYSISVDISKDYSGNKRPNGVVQYLITYYNKHGQETGYAWMSDLVYLSPKNNGGAADGENTCKVTLSITFDDNNKFTNFRVYSIFRSSLNIAQAAYIVADGEIIKGEPVIVTDDGAHLVTEDISRLLYIGSKDVKPYTLTHKDQTLFLGGIESTGQDYTWVRDAIAGWHIYDENTGLINEIASGLHWIEFYYNDGPEYSDDNGSYSYSSQLVDTSSEILSFKGGEKYRFALSFKLTSGDTTPAFWIGDAVNPLYPVIDKDNGVIKRVCARLIIPKVVYDSLPDNIAGIQLMMAEATYADRSIKAQGIVNPTMFNVWERYNNRLYSMPSWISRPRGSGFATRHFDVVGNSTSSTGEIQCNYWERTDDESGQPMSAPTPYYRLKGEDYSEYVDPFNGKVDYDTFLIVYGYKVHSDASGNAKSGGAWLVKANFKGGDPGQSYTNLSNKVFTINELITAVSKGDEGYSFSDSTYDATMYGTSVSKTSRKSLYTNVLNFLLKYDIPSDKIVDEETFYSWMDNGQTEWQYRVTGNLDDYYEDDPLDAFNSQNKSFILMDSDNPTGEKDYTSSFYKRHLMFVDENIVTLNSPEITYEAVNFDNASNYKFRIVGVAKITGGYSDYVVEATHGIKPGENLVSATFDSVSTGNVTDGLISWPLWEDYGLRYTGDPDKEYKDRDSSDYEYEQGNIVKYWLYMWNHGGNINGFSDSDNENKSSLISKTFANMRFSGYTMYNNIGDQCVYDNLKSLRIFNNTGSQYLGVSGFDGTVYYDGAPKISLLTPGIHKYKLLYSVISPDTSGIATSETAYLYSAEPVILDYASSPHAVIGLQFSDTGEFNQTILPKVKDFGEEISFDFDVQGETNALIPWLDVSKDDPTYRFKDYSVTQPEFEPMFDSRAETLARDDKYLFIGEVYYDFDAPGVDDTRYGGISEFAIQNNRFIPAGPMTRVGEMSPYYWQTVHVPFGYCAIGDRGDTYFQRWDCVKTIPSSAAANAANNVIDVTSVMLETHINIDGRTDLQRGTKYLASIDTEKYGNINPVYSQQDNFFSSRQLDEDMDQDAYRSSITWTLDKTDSADIDEWTHITLANSLKLDGDKGACQALRRFNNTIIAFQDRAISEILFNSRTQLSTTNGVPVEIANSGKVDGKRYITNKYGCVNKWSIIEGKAALYFVDNINKAFCAFGGQGIQPLSTKLGFDAWFRRINSVKSWTPEDTFNNIVSYYDRIHSDIYLIGTGKDYGDIPCLVYNETLGVFTSFYDYSKVPMMSNVGDRFVSVRDHKLWLQNEGMYCNFFGTDYGYSIEYRTTPDPYGDKIWTNVDYRADYYRLLDDSADSVVPERLMISGEYYDDLAGTYQDTKTFDSLRIWNEYQNTGEVTLGRDYTTDRTTRRKFRIWHVAIPRSVKTERNKWGLDRIRNPWISLLFKKNTSSENRKDMAQIHDVVVRYFE